MCLKEKSCLANVSIFDFDLFTYNFHVAQYDETYLMPIANRLLGSLPEAIFRL